MIADTWPLEAHLETLLRERTEGVGEHALLGLLRDGGWAPFDDARLSDELDLFRVHFVLFHVLYRLRDRLWQEQRGHLDISALSIRLYPYRQGVGALAQADPLREYYLDWSNLDMDREQVRHLLDGFWKRFQAGGERGAALAVLGLQEPVDYTAVKRQYRALAMRHHPDRGGDTATLQRINAAMAVLERCYRPG